jgi:uncharacterized membrane protein YphA (DoxX/SURF4 family)
MFPQAATSGGLVLLRISVAATLHLDALGQLVRATPAWYLAVLWLCSAALVAGFITPLFAAAAVVIELIVFAGSEPPSFWPAIAALNALALALLGPGGYSVDARLFGRRTVVMTVSREPDSPQRGEA